jgi:hypothetical protein
MISHKCALTLHVNGRAEVSSGGGEHQRCRNHVKISHRRRV